MGWDAPTLWWLQQRRWLCYNPARRWYSLGSSGNRQRRNWSPIIAAATAVLSLVAGVLVNLITGTTISDPLWWGITVGVVVLIGLVVAALAYVDKRREAEPPSVAEPVQPVTQLGQPAPTLAATPTTHSGLLPDLPTNVLARDHELDELEPLFAKRDAVVVVGKGGQGKTTFANLYAHRWQAQGRKLFWYDAVVAYIFPPLITLLSSLGVTHHSL